MGTAVAKRTATAVKLKPIADVVRQIKTHIYDANNAEARCVKHRLQAGQLLLQLRERIESGEAGNGINWWEWCEQHIERSRKDCETLLRIANAADPEAAALGDRERVRLAVAKHRERKAAEPPVTVTANEDADDAAAAANTGCNYDPADPRGKEEGEGIKVIRRRAWLVMAAESQSMAESFTACSGHSAIVGADPSEIDDEILARAWDAVQAWAAAFAKLEEKRASTSQDGRSEGAVDDCLSENCGGE